MNVKRTATIVLGGGAVAAWLAGAATSNRAMPDPVAPRALPIDARGTALAGEIARLHERLRPAATPHTPGRNLFTFRAAAAPAVAPPPRAAIAEIPLAPPGPAQPALKLAGISEDPGPGTPSADSPIRQAFISGNGQLFIVKEGEAVTPRYRVAKIASDGVELTDLIDGSSRRLVMR
jgi:hypothetical protein